MNSISGQTAAVLSQKTNDLSFEDCTRHPEIFFDILNEEWQLEVHELWSDYIDSSQVYVLKIHNKVMAGGIVFSKPTPDTLDYFDRAQQWFDKGYLYIGFVFVEPKERNQRLGTIWMQKIIEHLNPNPCWLAVDDRDLLSFYLKLGFTVAEEVNSNSGVKEWIMISK